MALDNFLTRDEATLSPTRYVQRLLPAASPNPYSFGGGLVHGGIPEETMGRLSTVLSFDYMGAGEYEFGAAAAALGRVAERAADGTYRAWSFARRITPVSRWLRREGDPQPWPGNLPASSGPVPVYVIANPALRGPITHQILTWARNPSAEFRQLKEPALVGRSLLAPDDDTPTGWLDLVNGYLFFSDAAQFAQVAAFFGLDAGGGVSMVSGA